MTWREFKLARLLLSEEKVGARIRSQQRGELDEDARGDALLRARGMVG